MVLGLGSLLIGVAALFASQHEWRDKKGDTEIRVGVTLTPLASPF
nr:hypothetical protein [Vibrio neptunius]